MESKFYCPSNTHTNRKARALVDIFITINSLCKGKAKTPTEQKPRNGPCVCVLGRDITCWDIAYRSAAWKGVPVVHRISTTKSFKPRLTRSRETAGLRQLDLRQKDQSGLSWHDLQSVIITSTTGLTWMFRESCENCRRKNRTGEIKTKSTHAARIPCWRLTSTILSTLLTLAWNVECRMLL